jgi:hypothetical protein
MLLGLDSYWVLHYSNAPFFVKIWPFPEDFIFEIPCKLEIVHYLEHPTFQHTNATSFFYSSLLAQVIASPPTSSDKRIVILEICDFKSSLIPLCGSQGNLNELTENGSRLKSVSGDETFTSSPGPIPKMRSAKCMAAVPLDTATAFEIPVLSQNSFSKASTMGPRGAM